jgi:diguanylate cyclase (GGDEF)-like protein
MRCTTVSCTFRRDLGESCANPYALVGADGITRPGDSSAAESVDVRHVAERKEQRRAAPAGGVAVTAAVQDLRRRAFIMRRIRVVIAALIPVEMLLYIPPPSIASALSPVLTSLLMVPAVLLIVAVSAAVHRKVDDPMVLARWARVELCADAAVALAILKVFEFDQFSSIWTVLVIVVLEGAFRAGLRGAIATWIGTGVVYAAIQIQAAQLYPSTAPLDVGSIIFRALVVGVVAVVAGQLASQLESAVQRHLRSEIALAEQYDDLRLIGRVSRAIAAGPEARLDVCQAVAELSGAAVVLLYEPTAGGLRATAVEGCPLEGLPFLSFNDAVSGTVEAFRSRTRVHRQIARLPEAVAAAVVFQASAGNSATFVPVLRDDRSIGVLILAFDRELTELPHRVAVALDVLAEEAAVAIARADAAVHLSDQARRDPLTGLVNRRGWEETLDAEMSRARRSAAPLSMLMLDLDGLKRFNDTHGHQAGDALIASAARSWESQLRPTDVLARFGGDEFAALLPGCDETTALRVAEALLSGLPPGASCSAGIAAWDGAEGSASLLARADAALYDGKRAGGGRAVRATREDIPVQRAPQELPARRPA